MSRDLAVDIVSAIVDELEDRKGIGDEWEQIDADIRREIVQSWRKLVRAGIDGRLEKKGHSWRVSKNTLDP